MLVTKNFTKEDCWNQLLNL